MRTFFQVVCLCVVLPVFTLVSGCRPSETPADQAMEEGGTEGSTSDGAERVAEDAVTAQQNGNEGARPGSVPADLPNVDGAGNFMWLSIGGSDLFSFEVSGKEYRTVCADQLALLGTAGWQLSSQGYEMDVDGALVKTLEKPGYALMVTCGDNTEEGAAVNTVSVALNRTKK